MSKINDELITMTECIKRKDALEFPFANGIYDHEHANEHFISGCESYREWIKQIPAADVRPVVRATWQSWEQDKPPCKWYSCCYCGFHALSKSNYCPNCGAAMEES